MIVYCILYLLCSFLLFPIGPWYYHIIVPYISIHIAHWVHYYLHVYSFRQTWVRDWTPEWFSTFYYFHATVHHTTQKPTFKNEWIEWYSDTSLFVFLPFLMYPFRHYIPSYSLIHWLIIFVGFHYSFHHIHNSHLYTPNFHTYHHKNPYQHYMVDFIDSIYGTIDPEWKDQRDISFDHYETLIIVSLLVGLFYRIYLYLIH